MAKTTKKKSPIASLLSKSVAAVGNKSSQDKKTMTDTKPVIVKLIKFLAVIYLLIWILIGILILIFIYGNFKQGAFNGLFSPRPPQQQTQVQPPAETDLPGIGKVNIQCIQDSLSKETIQKIVETGDASKLTDEEKGKLEPCIVEKEEASPSASPTPNK